MKDLVLRMAALYNSEINCGVSSFWDGGFDVWIGDDMNGKKAETNFDAGDLSKAADWLHDEAMRLFPESDYAKTKWTSGM